MSDFRTAVAQVVAGIAAGEVVTYGQVARLAGYPGAARAVGRAMAVSSGLPWWRVVTASGRLVPGLEPEQEAWLRAEGWAPEAAAGGPALARSLEVRRGGPAGVSPYPGSAPGSPARPRRRRP